MSGSKLAEQWRRQVFSNYLYYLILQKYERQRARDYARHKRSDPYPQARNRGITRSTVATRSRGANPVVIFEWIADRSATRTDSIPIAQNDSGL